MNERQNYIIHMGSSFGFLELIDVPKLVEACKEKWYNQTLCRVNDCLVRLGMHQGITVSKGIMHRPYVEEPTAVLMVEGATVTPTGD